MNSSLLRNMRYKHAVLLGLLIFIVAVGVISIVIATVLQDKQKQEQEYRRQIQSSLQSQALFMENNILLGQEGRAFVTKYRYGEGVGTEYKKYTYKCGKYYTCTGFIFTDRAKTVLNSALGQYYNETGIKHTFTVQQIKESLKTPSYIYKRFTEIEVSDIEPPLIIRRFLQWLAQPAKLIYTTDSASGKHKAGDAVPEGRFGCNWDYLRAPYDNTRFVK